MSSTFKQFLSKFTTNVKETFDIITNDNSCSVYISSLLTQDTQNGKEPVILQTYKPKVTGVLVVAEGAKNSKTKADIEKAVTWLYNITANKVNVYPMK